MFLKKRSQYFSVMVRGQKRQEGACDSSLKGNLRRVGTTDIGLKLKL